MKFSYQTWVIFRRQMRLALRNPAWVIIGLAQPVLYLALFGPLLKPLAAQIGTQNAYTFFVPGLLIQLGLFGALFAGFGLVSEWREGVIGAERVTPASRTALLLGRIGRDITLLAVQGIVLIALGFAFGMRGSLGGMILGLILTMFLGGACSASSNALALTLKSEDALAPILNSIALPVLLLAGILLPISVATGAPQWLVIVTDFMPIKYLVNALRELFVGNVGTITTMWGVLWTLLLFALGLWFGTRTFRKDNA
jgi:ABC-2 type transport system permease protein